jgi:hypothetical protein
LQFIQRACAPHALQKAPRSANVSPQLGQFIAVSVTNVSSIQPIGRYNWAAYMKLDKFIDVAGVDDMNESGKALYFAFYHLKKEKVEEFTAAQATKWIYDASLGNPNPTRLRQNLTRSASTVKGQAPGSFILHRNFVKELEGKFPQLMEQSQEVMDGGTILPLIAYEKTPFHVMSLAKQINLCYEQNIFDGCAVLMRRLEEVLLIMAYQKLDIDDQIKDGAGNYKMLEAIVKNAQSNTTLKLGRNGKEMIEKVREMGNYSAHSIVYVCRREYIKEKIEGYRLLVHELLHKAGLR